MRYTTVVLFALFASVASGQTADRKEPQARTVSVHGAGTVTTVPDQIRLTVQVNTRGESASAAMTEASRRTNSILAILKTYGVESKDIQTSRVGVSPILDYEKRVQPPPIIGYAGNNDFTVLFRGKQMDKIGEFLDQAVPAGASSFGGLMYEASKQREMERDALKKAASDGRARAEVLARELGATLGRVMAVSESVNGPNPFSRGTMAADQSVAAPVMVGELSINAQVEIVFELK